MPPRAGQYTSAGAMTRQVGFYQLGGRTADGGTAAANLAFNSWAAIRALSAQEIDKARQIGQKISHLVTVPYQTGIAESMQIGYQDGASLRMFQIVGVADPDEGRWELRITCFELNQNAGQNG